MTPEEQSSLLTTKELRERWGVSEGYLIAYRKAGLLPYTKIKGIVLYHEGDVIRFESQAGRRDIAGVWKNYHPSRRVNRA